MNPQPVKSGLKPPDQVPEKATRLGSSRALQWGALWLTHDSALIWTERMLQTLVRGDNQQVWHTLIDKVFSPKTLTLAFQTVTSRNRGAGVDGMTTEALRRRGAENEVPILQRQLAENRYRPKPARRVWIDKPGSRTKRPLGIPTARDRVVQHALRTVIEPIFEHSFHPDSYGFRPGRKAQEAIATVEARLKEGYHWIVDADIESYFDRISHGWLMLLIKQHIADQRVIALIEAFLEQGVMDTLKGWTPTEEGTPQGAIISPLLANIFLNELDHHMAKRGRRMVRYADDFVIQCQSEAEAHEALVEVQTWMAEVGLTLHPEKTKIADANQPGGFDFLGWHFERGMKWPRKKSQQRFKEAIRALTKRSNGHDLRTIICKVNRVTRGWGNYFRGGVESISSQLTKWKRMRLRSILRKRDNRKGRGRGLDQKRYPNDWLAERGLIFLHLITHPQSKQSQQAKQQAEFRKLRQSSGKASTGEPCAGNPPARF